MTDVSQQYSEWEGKHPWVKKAQKPIEEYSDKRIPQRIKQLYARMKALKEQLWNKKRELELGMFWESDYKITKSHPFIYAILARWYLVPLQIHAGKGSDLIHSLQSYKQ